MNRIMYVHYQLSAQEGSHTHTSAFAAAFGALCRECRIDFHVLSPTPVTESRATADPRGGLRSLLARWYLRDIKILLVQLRRAFREYRTLGRLEPDIVLTRFDDNTLSILWACRLRGIPAVIEVNSPEVEEITSHYRHIPFLGRLFTNRHALQLAHGAFTVSDVLSEELARHAPPGKPVVTIANGADTDVFNPAVSGDQVRRRFGLRPDDIVIGFVGSFAPWHGVDALLESFADLCRHHDDLKLLLVGRTGEHAVRLMERAREHGITDRVVFAGHVALNQVPHHIAAFDVATLPDTAYYCSPLKLFEYMAMGKAIAAVATRPVSAILRNGEHGLMFDRDTTRGLEECLSRLIAQPRLRASLGVAARDLLEREYTWNHNARRVRGLLDSVWANHRGATPLSDADSSFRR